MGIFNFAKNKKKAPKKAPKEEKKENAIVFNAVIRVLGSPKEHVKKTLEGFVDILKKNSDYKTLSTKVSKIEKVKPKEKEELKEPKEVELYAGYVDLEIGTNKKERIFDFCFNFMPISIEVVKPMDIVFSANEISRFLTDVQGRVHEIDWNLKMEKSANILLDKINKELKQKREVMTQNLIQMLQNNIHLALKEKAKDIKEISKNIGIPEDQIKPFLDRMIESKELVLENGKYSGVDKNAGTDKKS